MRLRHLAFYAFLLVIPKLLLSNGLEVKNLKCNQAVNPLSILNESPLFSWEISCQDKRNVEQVAYQILVASNPDLLSNNNSDIWDTGEVASENSWQVKYRGDKLESCRRYFWKVRIKDNYGEYSSYSNTSWFETGLLNEEDWHALWIAAPSVWDWRKIKEKRNANQFSGAWENEAPMFRKEFNLGKEVKSARMYVTGLGLYEAYLNGKRIGEGHLEPAFTRFDKTVLYSVYDITDLLSEKNAVGIMLGNGWYNMFTETVWAFDHAPWRGKPRTLMQIEIEYSDGTKSSVVTDETWKSSLAPVTFNSLMQGMVYDSRLEQKGWDEPEFDDLKWKEVFVVNGPGGKIKPQNMEPIKEFKEIIPTKITTTKDGRFLVDFGQNMAGWAKINLQGNRGDTITLHYGEVILNDSVYQRNISAYTNGEVQTDRFILKGTDIESYESKFTYHGFRYIEVNGFKGALNKANITALAASTDFEIRGNFECSDTVINKIHHNTIWSYRSNFFGYPTDCPHREKNGWTGDAQIAVETGLWNFDSGKAYEKFLKDMADEQRIDGNLSAIVPTSQWGYHWGNGPAWIGAYLIIPWNMYLYDRNVSVLEEHYDGMKKMVDFFTSQSENNILKIGLGDWAPFKTRTPVPLTSTAYYYYYSSILSETANILGNQKDYEYYKELSGKIKEAFNGEFYDVKTGKYANGSQTAQSCALYFNLVPAREKKKVLKLLLQAVEETNYHIDTGILGAKYLPHVLANNGYADIVFKLITNKTYPGWGWWVEKGATTLWEFWDGMESKPVGSLNHIMYGDLSNWFYQNIAGLSPDANDPGFKHFTIQPKLWDTIRWSRSSFNSVFGEIKVSTETNQGDSKLELEVPCNTQATINLPAKNPKDITEGGKSLKDRGIEVSVDENKQISVNVGSGKYIFDIKK